MKFLEFLDAYKQLFPPERWNWDQDKQMFTRAVHAYNTMAVLIPERCEECVRWEHREFPEGYRIIDNPFRAGGVKKQQQQQQVRADAEAQKIPTGGEATEEAAPATATAPAPAAAAAALPATSRRPSSGPGRV